MQTEQNTAEAMKLSQLKQQIEELDASYFPRESKREKDKLLITHGTELLRRLLVAEGALENLAQVVDIELRFEGHRTQLANELEFSKEALATIRGEEE